MATQDEYIKTALRLPRNLHAEIQASAANSARSMNAEIVARLQQTFASESEPQIGPSTTVTAEAIGEFNELLKSVRSEIANLTRLQGRIENSQPTKK